MNRSYHPIILVPVKTSGLVWLVRATTRRKPCSPTLLAIPFVVANQAVIPLQQRIMASSVKPDIPCSRCVTLFDEDIPWERHPTYCDMICQKYHTLNECKIAAAAGCHLRALLIGSLGPKDYQRLQEYPELASTTSMICVYPYPSSSKPDRLCLRPTFGALPHEVSKMTHSRQTIQQILTWPYAELELCDEERP